MKRNFVAYYFVFRTLSLLFLADCRRWAVMAELKFEMDERMTASVVFVDDDDDDDASICSIKSADDNSKPDARRGILRNATNNHQNVYANKQPVHYAVSSPSIPHRSVQSTVLHKGDGIFWPDWETIKKPYYQASGTGIASERRQTGNEAGSREFWEAHNETGSSVVARKKLTVRFSPEADDDACVGGGGQRAQSDDFEGHVQGHRKQSQGHAERRRLNIGRIAENKFNDGRNPGSASDTTSSTTRSDSFKTGRKWYHFSFRSNKNREKSSPEMENQSTNVHQLIHAEARSSNEQVEIRCRGRREMREASSYRDNETIRTLAAQGYRLMTSSVSEPEQLGGHGPWAESSRQNWNQRVFSSSSTDDLRRSPTIRHDDRKPRGSAVRRSCSTVGVDRRRQTTTASSPTPESITRFPTRRNSTHLADRIPSATTAVAVEPGAVSVSASTDQQARFGWYYWVVRPSSVVGRRWMNWRFGWYYGLDGHFDRQAPETTRDVAYNARKTEQVNSSSGVESKHNRTDAGYPTVATSGGEVVWSGHNWTTPRQIGTLMTPVEGDRDRTLMISNGGTTSHEINALISSNVASNYILQRGTYLPVARVQSQNWSLERHCGVGRGLPQITVTPATDERRRRCLPTSENLQLSTTLTQSHLRPSVCWGSTMTTTNHDDQLSFHCCGCHGRGLWPSWYRPVSTNLGAPAVNHDDPQSFPSACLSGFDDDGHRP